MRDKETITIPLNKVSYEDLEALTIEQQTQLFVKDKEIERLNRTNNEIFKANETLAEEIKKLQTQLQQKENIIKEVREYILTHKLYCFKYDDEELFEITTDKKAKDDLLNILRGADKE